MTKEQAIVEAAQAIVNDWDQWEYKPIMDPYLALFKAVKALGVKHKKKRRKK